MSIYRYQQQKKAVEKAIGEKIEEYRAIYKKAETEDRDPTEDERLRIESHLKEIETLKTEKEEVEAQIKTIEHVNDIGRELGPSISSLSDVHVGSEPKDRSLQLIAKSLGEQFTESTQFKSLHQQIQDNGGRLPQNFSTGPVPLQMKAGTLFEGTGGQGAGLIPVPQVIPGQVQKLFQRLTIADLLMSGQTSTNSLRYVVEGTATSGAAGVAEGGAKPASDLSLSTVDEPVKKIATVLTVSDEMLEDVQQVQAYINGRLVLFVQIEEERQLVSGAGTNELIGITNNGRSINTYGRGTVDNNAVALFKAMNGQRGSSFLEPDFIVMNPANWQTTRLLTDTAGQFFGGGPFMGQYGSGQMVGDSSQVQGPQDYLWGKPVIVTTAVGSGTALVGTSSAAQVWRRGGVSVEATNSHSTYFTSNLVAIRAEERLALAVYRPAAFTLVSGLS
jgi:HK97 family phage major capsid protein